VDTKPATATPAVCYYRGVGSGVMGCQNRILKMIATYSFLTVLECTKFVFARGFAPEPARGAYNALPDRRPPSWFKGDPPSKERR